jgi:hypothetical protein
VTSAAVGTFLGVGIFLTPADCRKLTHLRAYGGNEDLNSLTGVLRVAMPLTLGLVDLAFNLVEDFTFSLEVFWLFLFFVGLSETDSTNDTTSISSFGELEDVVDIGTTSFVAKDCSSLITTLTLEIRFRFDLFSDESSIVEAFFSLFVESDLLFLLFNGDCATGSITLFNRDNANNSWIKFSSSLDVAIWELVERRWDFRRLA